MMLWIFFTLYVVAGLATYRRVGYAVEKAIGTNDRQQTHEYRSVCERCRCKNCGGTWGNHFVYRFSGESCAHYEQRISLHARTIFAAIPAMALWWLIAGVYGLVQAKRVLGIGGPSQGFFVEPPKALTKDEKREAQILAQETRLAELDREIAKAEKELGIS